MSGSLHLAFSKDHVKFKKKYLEIKAYGGVVSGPDPAAEQQRRRVHTQLGSLLVGTLYLLSPPPLSLTTLSRKRSLNVCGLRVGPLDLSS